MENELLKKAADIFDTNEKWLSFMELYRVNVRIMESWYLKLQDEIEKINFNEKWIMRKIGTNCQWYLKEFDVTSLSIWFEKDYFSLWADPSHFDVQKISYELKNMKYNSICNDVFKRDVEFNGSYLIREKGRYEFKNSLGKNDFSFEDLAWYAGNATNEFVIQIEKKLLSLMNNTNTNLFVELNTNFKR